MESFEQCFDAVIDYCRDNVAEATYNLFIKGIEPSSFDGATASLTVSSNFQKQIVETRYVPLIKEGFLQLLGFDVNVEIISRESLASGAESPMAKDFIPSGEYSYTFNNFIVGPNNRFAHAAAQAVAANPSASYNPLFIWGASGLGKTHLLYAIKNDIMRAHPDYNIIYVDGEIFANALIKAIQNGSTSDFHEKYRSGDVLLVDDIQFIGGKESTQEEFFHTFNTLYKSNKQIVLTSDRPPKEIKSLDERLRTRFEWGLIADVQSPDLETRIAILQRKANIYGMDLPDDVAEYIANRLKDNIRQLEGTIKKLNAYRMINGAKPTLMLAQEAIKDIMQDQRPVPITVEKIIGEVSRTYNISDSDIRSNKRDSDIANARQIAMYVIREVTGLPLEDIGEKFSNRNHATVTHSIKKVAKQMETDSRLRETIEDIIKNSKS